MKPTKPTKTANPSTQSKFIDKLRELAKSEGLQLIHNPNFSNTGELRFERSNSFRPLLIIGYSFQQGYATFTGDVADSYAKFDELDKVYQGIQTKVVAQRGKR